MTATQQQSLRQIRTIISRLGEPGHDARDYIAGVLMGRACISRVLHMLSIALTMSFHDTCLIATIVKQLKIIMNNFKIDGILFFF